MFNDIFPMMATHQMELDNIVHNILTKIRINGTENQSFSVTVPSNFSESDREYIENEINRKLGGFT